VTASLFAVTFAGQPADNGAAPMGQPLSVSVNPRVIFADIGTTTDETSAVVTGGIPPYTYEWSEFGDVTPTEPNGPTTAFVVGDNANTNFQGSTSLSRTVTVTDSAGQTDTGAVTLTVLNLDFGGPGFN